MVSLIIAANYPNPPYFYSTVNENYEEVITNGIDYHLIKTLSFYLNFTYAYVHSNWSWGNVVNNSWDGLVGKILNGSADMALGALSATPQREKVVDFTAPYYYSDITFVTRLKKRSAFNADIFIKPFHAYVWLSLVFTIIYLLILLKLLKQNFNISLWIIICGLLQKGNPLIPRQIKLLAIIWLFFGLIFTQIYSAFLFSFMTELLPQPEISSIFQLAYAVNDGHYIPAAPSTGSLYNQINGITSKPLSYIGETLINVDKALEAMELIATKESNIAFIGPRPIILARSQHFPRNMFNIPPKNDETTFIMEQLSISLRKNSTLKNKINKM